MTRRLVCKKADGKALAYITFGTQISKIIFVTDAKGVISKIRRKNKECNLF